MHACVCSTVVCCLDICLVTVLSYKLGMHVHSVHTDRQTTHILHIMECYRLWCVYICPISTYRQLSHNKFRVVPSAFLYGTKLTTL